MQKNKTNLKTNKKALNWNVADIIFWLICTAVLFAAARLIYKILQR